MANPNPAPHARFPKGVSPNPGGKPGLPKALKNVKEFTADEIKRIIAKYMRMAKGDLEATLKDSAKLPMLEAMIASIIANAYKSGDFSKLDFLLNRSIGKVKDVSEVHTHAVDPEKEKLIDKMNKEKVFELLRSSNE